MESWTKRRDSKAIRTTAARQADDHVSAVEPGGLTRAIRLEMPQLQFEVAVVVPNFAIPTKEARAVLPDTYSQADLVFNLQRTALLIAGLATGDASVFLTALDDRLHQPFRAQLVPGLAEILRLRKQGLLGCTLSGAGPAVPVFSNAGGKRRKWCVIFSP